MLTSLSVRNFQKHRKLRIDFSKYVTTIVGPTDAGKSAIIRALRMACFNKPAKDSYIRRGQSKMTVTLEVDGHKVTRQKGKGLNKYFLDGKVYKSFGSGGVPADIATTLNVDQVNFQQQLDLHYWFGDSASQVSRNLNQIVNLEIIDKALSNAAAFLRRARTEEEIILQRFEIAKHKKRELSWVPEFCAGVERLETLREAHEAAAGKATALAFLTKEVRAHNKRLRMLTLAHQTGQKAVSAGAKATAAARRVKDLQEIISGIKEADKFINVKLPNFEYLSRVRHEADLLAERRRELEMCVNELKLTEKELCQVDLDLRTATSRYEAAAKNRRCPTCGRKLLPSPVETSTCQHGRRSLARRK